VRLSEGARAPHRDRWGLPPSELPARRPAGWSAPDIRRARLPQCRPNPPNRPREGHIGAAHLGSWSAWRSSRGWMARNVR